MSQIGSLKMIKLQRAVENHEAVLQQIVQKLTVLDSKITAFGNFIGVVDKFLDEKFPGWDDGIKKKIRDGMRSEVASEAEQMLRQADETMQNGTPEEIVELANRIWTFYCKIGHPNKAAALVAGMYVKAKNFGLARRILRHLKNDDGTFVEGCSQEFIDALESRISQEEAAAK